MPTTSPSGRRATTSPRPRRGSARAEPVRREPPRRPALTGRAAVLTLVLAALVLSLALPLREYLDQRGRIDELRASSEATQAEIDRLTAEQQRWSDPAYVAAQARSRLHFVMPGEVGYVVLGPDEAPAPGTRAADTTDRTWYGTLWGSLERAGRPAAPSPATTAPSKAPTAATSPRPAATPSTGR